jgi:long-chain acyl-CoA synthetase
MNIVAVIRSEIRGFEDKTAAIEGDRKISYRDLLARIGGLHKLLSARGIAAGQRIAFRSSDGIDYIVGALALLECGAAVVPVADSLTPDEIAETIERIDVHGILTHRDMPNPAGEPLDAVFHWQARQSHSPQLDARCREMGAAFIRFSSGTTGQSKGVVLSHRSIVERTDAANQGLGISDRDVILWVLSMSHHFVVSILLFLRRGATIVVGHKMFPFSILEAVQNNSCTFIYGSPLHYYLLAMAPSVPAAALGNVRLAISTAMKMSPDFSDQFSRKFGFAPAEAYGIIEIGLPFINTEPASTGQPTVGKMLPGYQLRIANPDSAGIGEVLIKGPGMFDAYFSPWQSREELLLDGYFHTGDIGRLDERGRLFLMGRSKTVIVCAGMKVFPEEVEQTIDSMPGVVESLVSGRDHPQMGQIPVADIVIDPDIHEAEEFLSRLREHCCRKLSSYKVPVEFRVALSLLKTPSGKLARRPASTGAAT